MNNEQLLLSNVAPTHHKPSGRLPDPPIFNVNGLKYTVPPYYSYWHPETQFLINMIRGENWERIFRVIITNPDYLNNTYCQYPDTPEPLLGQPMYHRKAILYLTPLGMAIYFRKHKIVNKMLELKSENGKPFSDVNQPCFVTNYLERFENRNDIMLIYPFCIMFRRECFEVIQVLLENNWKSQNPIKLPYRRICQIYTFHYKDIIEYCLAQMATRPNLRLYRLIEELILAFNENFDVMRFEKICVRDRDDNEKDDFISIPRRLLRYLQYYDKDLRIMSQLVMAIKSMQKQGFFIGPRRQCWECNLTPADSSDEKGKIINDQDNIIALMLSLTDDAEMKGHAQSKDKLLELLAFILLDTKWFIQFLIRHPREISEYFTNLNEHVNKIKFISIENAKTKLIYILDVCEADWKNIEELYNYECPKNNWRTNLTVFLLDNADKFGLSTEDLNNHPYIDTNRTNEIKQSKPGKSSNKCTSRKSQPKDELYIVDKTYQKEIIDSKQSYTPKAESGAKRQSQESSERKPPSKIQSIKMGSLQNTKDDENSNDEDEVKKMKSSKEVNVEVQPIKNEKQSVSNMSQSVENMNQSIKNEKQSVSNASQSVENMNQSIKNEKQSINNENQSVENMNQSIKNEKQSINNENQLVRNASAELYNQESPIKGQGESNVTLGKRSSNELRIISSQPSKESSQGIKLKGVDNNVAEEKIESETNETSTQNTQEEPKLNSEENNVETGSTYLSDTPTEEQSEGVPFVINLSEEPPPEPDQRNSTHKTSQNQPNNNMASFDSKSSHKIDDEKKLKENAVNHDSVDNGNNDAQNLNNNIFRFLKKSRIPTMNRGKDEQNPQQRRTKKGRHFFSKIYK